MSSPVSTLDWILVAVQVLTLLVLVIYVLKTAAIARGTLDLAKETRESRRALFAPRVVVYFDPDERHFAHIIVKNVGSGVASDVRVKFEPPLQTTREGGTDFFQSPKLLPPGSELAHYFDTWQAYLGSDLPKRYAVTVTYKGVEDQLEHTIEHELDTTSIEHLHGFVRHGMHDLVGAVKDQTKKLAGEIEEVRRQLVEQNARGLLHRTRGASVPAAVADIKSLWAVIQAASEAESARAFVPPAAIAAALRRAALSGVDAAQVAGDELVSDAFARVAVVTLQIWPGGDRWESELQLAVEALLAAPTRVETSNKR